MSMPLKSPPLYRSVRCVLVALLGLSPALRAAEHGVAKDTGAAVVAPASGEAEEALRKFRLPKGWKAELIAAEPNLANPVAFAFDEQERIYVVETFRHGNGVLDIRGRGGWPSAGYKRDLPPARRARLPEEALDRDLANRTVEDRDHMLRDYFRENLPSLESHSDRVRLIRRGPDGRATGATVFADGFNAVVDGLASGVLARNGDVYFTNIPNLWKFRDNDGDGVAEERTVLHHGYGVRVGFLGHDLHGLTFGPDGRLYFTIGDRGASVVTREGTRLETPDTGAVFRCEPDGSGLEIYASGLRNPQELAFDAWGNLWTGDNNSDGGDQARWTHLVEGGDSGWHIGWQFIESPNPRGPWNSEGMWRPEDAAKIAYLVPPLANIGAGPSGLTYAAGTGLPDAMNGHFFLVDFRGGPSGIWDISVKPKGAGYEVAAATELMWNALPTDVELGPDGGLYWSDWVEGWSKTGKGRIYRLSEPESAADPRTADTRQWLRVNLSARPAAELAGLLAHPDLRVRQRAQFALAGRGEAEALLQSARSGAQRWARLHGVWGLWQIGRTQPDAVAGLRSLLGDADSEVRAQAARVLGDVRHAASIGDLVRLLGDPEPRPRFYAAIALGRLGPAAASAANQLLVSLLERNADTDAWLRHAGVMGLTGTLGDEALAGLANHASPAVRRAAVVALRRHQSPQLARFLKDSDPTLVLEAARAIHDLPVAAAMPALAGLLGPDERPAPLQRRILSANRRAGGPSHAAALADYAASSQRPEALRAEAVGFLGEWPTPSGRDAVTGLWRPLAARDAAPAREALQRQFTTLLNGPQPVMVAAVEAAAALEMRNLAGALKELVRNTGAPAAARVAALEALAGWKEAGLGALLAALAGDTEEAVRAAALKLASAADPADALAALKSALDKGGVREQQAALIALGALPGDSAAALLRTWAGRTIEGKVAPELLLEVIEAVKAREGTEWSDLAERVEKSMASDQPVQARRFALRGGDAALGRRVFYEREQVQCVRCHKAGGDGGVVGPDLAGVGTRLTREALLESIVNPNALVAAGYENLRIETRDGDEYSGTIQKETDTELVLNTVDAGPVTVPKSAITFRKVGLSGMPEGLADLISARDLRDLVEYLTTLKAGQ